MFDKQSGFYLLRHSDITCTEKAYGVHEQKVEKVLKSFERNHNKNLGVVLSGDKGIGKSFFGKLLCAEAVKRGMPVIVVDRYINGIANYIEGIEQEVLVFFDEFDKTFADVKQGDNMAEPQTEMLTLFDGIAGGRKLFVITCNNIYNVSKFLINRPGRFHYHFRFDYPSSPEIRQYMHDKFGCGEWEDMQIEEVIKFSKKVPLNYDCLRAICFELEGGDEFREAIKDLNIVNTENNRYDVALHYTNGEKAENTNILIDMFNDTRQEIWLFTKENEDFIRCVFDIGNAVFDSANGEYRVSGDKINITYECDEGYDDKIKYFKSLKTDYLSIKPHIPKNLHYII